MTRLNDAQKVIQLHNLLLDCLDYFDRRADADMDQGVFIPNEELHIQQNIENTLQLCELPTEIKESDFDTI